MHSSEMAAKQHHRWCFGFGLESMGSVQKKGVLRRGGFSVLLPIYKSTQINSWVTVLDEVLCQWRKNLGNPFPSQCECSTNSEQDSHKPIKIQLSRVVEKVCQVLGNLFPLRIFCSSAWLITYGEASLTGRMIHSRQPSCGTTRRVFVDFKFGSRQKNPLCETWISYNITIIRQGTMIQLTHQ